MINILTRKLDYSSKRAYEEERDRDTLPTIEESFEIIEKRCSILQNINSQETRQPKASAKLIRQGTALVGSVNTQTGSVNTAQDIRNSQLNNAGKCTYCSNSNHRIYTCTLFKGLDSNTRKQFR